MDNAFVQSSELPSKSPEQILTELSSRIGNAMESYTKLMGLESFPEALRSNLRARVAQMSPASTAALEETILATDDALVTAANEIVEKIQDILSKELEESKGRVSIGTEEEILRKIRTHLTRANVLEFPRWRVSNCISLELIQMLIQGSDTGVDTKPKNVSESHPDTISDTEQKKSLEESNNDLLISRVDIENALNNMYSVALSLAERGNRLANYATIFRHKLLSAEESAPQYLKRSYAKALECDEEDLLSTLNSITVSARAFLDTMYSTESVTLEAFLQEFISFLGGKINNTNTAILREYLKVLASDGRLFMFNQLPEEEYEKYEGRLVTVDEVLFKELQIEI